MRTLENGSDVAYVYTNVFLYGIYIHRHNANALACFSALLWVSMLLIFAMLC